jgi:nucleoside-diphosphate-sugar epimerase
MERHALIAGVSGIIGRHLAEHLIATKGWSVTGISRHKHDLPKGVKHIAVDLTDEDSTKAALKRVKPTDVFITTWLRQATEAENCRVNAGMVRNLLNAVDGKNIKHAALVTGLKHYMGPFEAYAKSKMVTPFLMVRASPAYADWLRCRQSNEHGGNTGCLCRDLQRNGSSFRVPRFAAAI